MRIILASGSQRRKDLMEMMKINFEITVSNINETLEENITIEENSEKLAYRKAKEVFKKTKGERVVIGSDTLVIKDNNIYGKPKSRKEARNMLQIFSNSYHDIITSLCLLIEKNGKKIKYQIHDKVKIHVKQVTNDEIEEWLNYNQYQDKAGAYSVQSIFGALYVDKIEGSYYTAVGLPTDKLYEILKKEKII